MNLIKAFTRVFSQQRLQFNSISLQIATHKSQRQQQQICKIHSKHNKYNKHIMGGMSCKEYKTTNRDGSSKCGKNESGTVGMYSTPDHEQSMVVCSTDDLQENEMKQFDFLGDGKVLMIKQRGKLYAVGAKCPHYGAPLQTGVLGEGRVRCPWHGACFNINTGDIEDFPGLDSIPCYRTQVEEDTGNVKVYALQREVGQTARTKPMAELKERDKRVFIVVGGGPAGAVCVETLRQQNFTGRIIMISAEQHLPYDRVKVTKALDLPIESILLRNAEFYEEHNIEVKLNTRVTKLDAKNKSVQLSDESSLNFNKIFFATGSSPIRPPIPGVNLRNVFTMREHSDGGAVISAIQRNTHAVCLGSSFIALETAAYLAGKVESVTLVCRDSAPLGGSFGAEIGCGVAKLFERNNVKVLVKSGILEIIDDGHGAVGEVKLKDESKIPCNLLILGTGARPNTSFLQDTGVMVNANGSVNTDLHLMTNTPDIYVGGDIANAPVYPAQNECFTIGHYQLAQYHGQIAALNMAGTIKELHAVPYFFTMFFGKGIRYSGYGQHTAVYVVGDLEEEFKFVAYFLDGGDYVIAVATCGRDPLVSTFAEMQHQGKRLHLSEIDENESWAEKLKTPVC